MNCKLLQSLIPLRRVILGGLVLHLLCASVVYGQDRVVSGKVTSIDDGQSLPGTNVVLKGTTRGAVTDANGDYSIEVPSDDAVLIFSSIGYATQEIQVGNQTTINLAMESDLTSLQEVVIVGYNTVKKGDVTGAIVSVGEEELKSRPVMNALEALQGKAAGVDIRSNERPGEIGAIRIRGERSLTASNSPLYVVDGIPLMSSSGIESLNPLDIESIDILKDASATAIYGARGANGVVIVTTKRGKAGKMTINYSGSVTTEKINDRAPMMNASDYITWKRWAAYYSAPDTRPRGDEPTEADDLTLFGNTDAVAWANIQKGWEGGTWDGSKVKSTDWTEFVTQTSVTQTHTISVGGGSDKVRAFGSFGYLDNEGTIKGQSYKRYSSNVSVDLTPKEWFEMGVSVNASFQSQQFGQSRTGGSASGPDNVFSAAKGVFSYALPYDNDGNRIDFPGGDAQVKTVVDEWKYTDNLRETFRVLGSMYAQVNILPGLRYRVNFGPDFRYYKNGIFIDEKSTVRFNSPNYASLTNGSDFSYTLDNLLYYNRTIDRHAFGATLLQSASKWNITRNSVTGQGVPLPSAKWDNMGSIPVASLLGWGSNLTERQLMSYMGRVTYGYDDKYLLTASIRYDGASQLSEGHKWDVFPSASVAWKVSEESFMTKASWVNGLKVRVGVGVTGNSAVDPYATKGPIASVLYPYGATPTQGFVPTEFLIANPSPMANQNVGWEKTTQWNFGVDFSVFNNRVSGAIDLYTSHTNDLLLQMSIPALTGYTTTFANVGETKNRGIDITLNTVNVDVSGFTWSTTLNAAYQKNEIVSLANGKQDDIANNWFIGESVGIIYGYASDGLWKEEDAEEMTKFNDNGHTFSAGMSRPVDQNGDYQITPNDDRVVIGHTVPRWNVGMTNTFTYKGFDLSVQIYGRLGYTFNTDGEWQGGRYMQRQIDYYNENNKDAYYQKPILSTAGGDPYYQILGYMSGSFLKIRTINLGYTFPNTITDKLGVGNLKVYVQAKNPGMLYSSIDFLDMDLQSSVWNRGFVVGLDVQF